MSLKIGIVGCAGTGRDNLLIFTPLVEEKYHGFCSTMS